MATRINLLNNDQRPALTNTQTLPQGQNRNVQQVLIQIFNLTHNVNPPNPKFINRLH